MRAGQRDTRIKVAKRVTTRDSDTNEVIESYMTVARVWGERLDSTGGEYLKAGGIQAEQRAVFRIPYQGNLTTSHRLLAGGLSWNIEAFRDLAGRRRYLEIQATAIRDGDDG